MTETKSKIQGLVDQTKTMTKIRLCD